MVGLRMFIALLRGEWVSLDICQFMPVLSTKTHNASVPTAFFAPDLDIAKYLEIQNILLPEIHWHRHQHRR